MILFGRNIFLESLRAQANILEVFVETKPAYEWFLQNSKALKAKPKITEGLPASVRKENHQGIAFQTDHDFYQTCDAAFIREHSLSFAIMLKMFTTLVPWLAAQQLLEPL